MDHGSGSLAHHVPEGMAEAGSPIIQELDELVRCRPSASRRPTDFVQDTKSGIGRDRNSPINEPPAAVRIVIGKAAIDLVQEFLLGGVHDICSAAAESVADDNRRQSRCILSDLQWLRPDSCRPTPRGWIGRMKFLARDETSVLEKKLRREAKRGRQLLLLSAGDL